MDRNSSLILRKVIIDVAILLAVGLPVLAFFLFGKARQRGFFCHDESLMYPYHDSTVSNNLLYIVGTGLPVAVILVSEVIISRTSAGQSALSLLGRTVPPWVVNAYKFIGAFAFGAACSQLTTDIAKYLVGRLRPHFFDVCNPNVDCNLPENQHKYIENYRCRGEGSQPARRIKDVGLSFPSGHSSFSAYTMLYLACYIQCRMRWKGSKLVRHGLQFVCLMLSWGTAMSRISDFKHHWSDVLAGILIGCTTAALTVKYVSNLITERSSAATCNSEQHQHPPANGISLPDYSDGSDIHGMVLHDIPGTSDSAENELCVSVPLLTTSTTNYGSHSQP